MAFDLIKKDNSMSEQPKDSNSRSDPVPPELFQDPIPILRFTIQFPWAMKSGNSAKFAEKHEVRKACSQQIQKAVEAIYGSDGAVSKNQHDESKTTEKLVNQARAALAGIAIAIKSYLSNPQCPLSKLAGAAQALKEAGEKLKEAEAGAAQALKEAGEKLKAAEAGAAQALKEAGEKLKAAGEALTKTNTEAAEALTEAGAAQALKEAGEKLRAAALGWGNNIEGARNALLDAAKLAASVQAAENQDGSNKTHRESLVRTLLHINAGTSGSPVPINVTVEWPVLVKKNARCLVELDVEIATKEPGWALASGLLRPGQQGPDLDNLLKTICDGLRFPGDQNANPDAETCISIAEGRPFYCLVEDDALIRRINSRSTVLLEDLTDNNSANSRVTVNVAVLSYRFPNYSGNAASAWSPDIKGLLTPPSE